MVPAPLRPSRGSRQPSNAANMRSNGLRLAQLGARRGSDAGESADDRAGAAALTRESPRTPSPPREFGKAPPQVTIHKRGWLEADPSKIVDDTREAGMKPDKFPLGGGGAISGLQEATATMRRGEVAYFAFGPEKGFGEEGSQPHVPANARLVYEVELALSPRGLCLRRIAANARGRDVDISWRRIAANARGRDVESPRRGVAATPRRGYSFDESRRRRDVDSPRRRRGDAGDVYTSVETSPWILFRGDGSRRRRRRG